MIDLIGIAVAFLRHPDEDAEDEAIDRGEGVIEPNEVHWIIARDGTVLITRCAGVPRAGRSPEPAACSSG